MPWLTPFRDSSTPCALAFTAVTVNCEPACTAQPTDWPVWPMDSADAAEARDRLLSCANAGVSIDELMSTATAICSSFMVRSFLIVK